MKHSLTRYGVLSAVLLATAAPVLAASLPSERGSTQVAQVMPHGRDKHRHQTPGPRQPDKPDSNHAGKHKFGHERRGPALPGIEMAAKLSATEVYVGVTHDQEDVWRAYTSALINFFDRPMSPEDDRDGDARTGRGPAPLAERERHRAPGAAPLFAERLAERAIAQGEKARALKEAVEALRAALNDEQLVRLTQAERAFAPPGPEPHGRDRAFDGHPGQDHDHGERPESSRDLPPPAADE